MICDLYQPFEIWVPPLFIVDFFLVYADVLHVAEICRYVGGKASFPGFVLFLFDLFQKGSDVFHGGKFAGENNAVIAHICHEKG
jgi:hypothetical protein